MRRRVIGVAAVTGLVVAVGFAGSALATTQHTHAFTLTDLGATISMHGTSSQSVIRQAPWTGPERRWRWSKSAARAFLSAPAIRPPSTSQTES